MSARLRQDSVQGPESSEVNEMPKQTLRMLQTACGQFETRDQRAC